MLLVRNLLKVRPLQQKYCHFFSSNNQTRIDPRKDYYAILQVPHNASPYQIKQAFLRQEKNYNPYAKEAFDILSNFTLREQYHKMRSQNYSNYEENPSSKEDQNFYKDYASSRPNLTPEEQKMAQKLNSGVKKLIYVLMALGMFGPFFFWKGGNKSEQELAADAMYPRRYGGMSMERPVYQNQYNQDPRMYPQNQGDVRSMGNPGYTVTGKIVYD